MSQTRCVGLDVSDRLREDDMRAAAAYGIRDVEDLRSPAGARLARFCGDRDAVESLVREWYYVGDLAGCRRALADACFDWTPALSSESASRRHRRRGGRRVR